MARSTQSTSSNKNELRFPGVNRRCARPGRQTSTERAADVYLTAADLRRQMIFEGAPPQIRSAGEIRRQDHHARHRNQPAPDILYAPRNEEHDLHQAA